MTKPDRTLSDSAAVAEDPRPRFLLVATPDGMSRVRRMPVPQLYTQVRNFRRLQIDPAAIAAAGSPAQIDELSRFLQRCLVETGRDVLICPGYRGLQRVLTWSLRARVELAQTAAAFMEI